MPDEESKNLTVITTEIIMAAAFTLALVALFGKYINEVLAVYQRFLDWFYSVDWKHLNFIFSIIFSVINIALIVFTLRIIKIYEGLARQPEVSAVKDGVTPDSQTTPKKEVELNWKHVQELIKSENNSDWNMAVMRADSLLDEILIVLGYEGESMADRLKIVGSHTLPSIERVWSAHRLRNEIAHNPLIQTSRNSCEYAIKTYEQALFELGLLEKKKDSANL